MPEVGYLWHGILLGLAVAMPVGPVGLLCMRRSLRGGAWQGLVSGLGAAVADALYGVVGLGGFALFARLLEEHEVWFDAGGALLLAFFGVRMMRRPPPAEGQSKGAVRLSRGRAIVSSFMLTMANPLTALVLAGMMAGLNVQADTWAEGTWLVGGIFLGSALWWLVLSQMTARVRHWLSPQVLHRLDVGGGLLLLAFAGAAAVRWAELVSR